MNLSAVSVTLKDGQVRSQQMVDFALIQEKEFNIHNIAISLIKKDAEHFTISVNKKEVSLYGGCEVMPPTEVTVHMATQVQFKAKEGFLKITLKDGNTQDTKTRWWLDPEWTDPECPNDVYVWNYKPRLLPIEEIKAKCRQFKIDFPDFNTGVAFYNRHGIVAWGYNKGVDEYAIFYASPLDEKMRKLSDKPLGSKSDLEDCGELAEVSYNRSELFAVSKNRYFSLLKNAKHDCLLNYEPAEILLLKDI